jgi:hypothetical protein
MPVVPVVPVVPVLVGAAQVVPVAGVAGEHVADNTAARGRGYLRGRPVRGEREGGKY